jgi:hypothetical protein
VLNSYSTVNVIIRRRTNRDSIIAIKVRTNFELFTFEPILNYYFVSRVVPGKRHIRVLTSDCVPGKWYGHIQICGKILEYFNVTWSVIIYAPMSDPQENRDK